MRLLKYDTGPPGGWVVTDGRTGFVASGITYGQMRDVMEGQWANNNLEPFDIDDALCARLEPEDRHIFCGEPLPWPLVLRPFKLLAKEGDRGLGDIVERVVGPIGGDAYKLWYQNTFGKSCGCTKRADNLNVRYPL